MENNQQILLLSQYSLEQKRPLWTLVAANRTQYALTFEPSTLYYGVTTLTSQQKEPSLSKAVIVSIELEKQSKKTA